MTPPIRTLVLIDAFRMGGAETLLAPMIAASRGSDIVMDVVSVSPEEFNSEKTMSILAEAGITTRSLGIRRLLDPVALPRLTKFIRRGGYDIVHAHLEMAMTLAVPALIFTALMKTEPVTLAIFGALFLAEPLGFARLAVRADVYALGILAYWLLVGRHPFTARTRAQMLEQQINAPVPIPSDARPDLPRGSTGSPNPPEDGWNVPLLRNGMIVEQPATQTTLTQRYAHEAKSFIAANKSMPFPSAPSPSPTKSAPSSPRAGARSRRPTASTRSWPRSSRSWPR